MDPSVFPNTIDYWGPVGMVFLRNPQLRWTPFETEHLTAAIAVESPSSGLDQGKVEASDISDLGEDVSPWNQYPDSTAQIRWQDDWGHVQLAGILRVLGFEIRGNEGREPDGQQLAGAANLSGSFNLFEADQILWQVVGGAGFANYMNDGGVDLAPAGGLDGAKAVPGLGWLLYYNRTWNEKFTSSIGFSEHRQWNSFGQTGNAYHNGQYGNVNLLWHPTPDMFVGPEFVFGRRVNANAADNTDKRIQLSFMYKFGGTMFERRR